MLRDGQKKTLLWLLQSDVPLFSARALYPAERRWTLMKKAGQQTALSVHGLLFCTNRDLVLYLSYIKMYSELL